MYVFICIGLMRIEILMKLLKIEGVHRSSVTQSHN